MADPFDSSNSYVPTPNPTSPNTAQSPAPWNLNAIGDEYATAYSRDETSLIQRAIAEKIFDAVPAKYNVLRLLFDKPVKYVPSDTFTYMEKTFGRTVLQHVSNDVVGSAATQDIELTTGGAANITVNKIIVYPTNRKAIVTAVNTTTDVISVSRLNGQANLPALAGDEYFAIQSSVIADGQNFLSHYDRMRKIERYNYVQLMHRDKRWTRKEMQKFANLGTTDYFALDKKEQLDLLLQDMFATLWNGERAEADVTTPDGTGTYKAKTAGGIYPLMVAAGSSSSTGVTSAQLKDTFETLCFATNYKADGAVRFVFAQDQLLYELAKEYKETGTRYSPNDKIADLNLMEYRIGGMRLVPVSTELFKETSLFPATWGSRIFVLDLDTIQPVCMTGYEPIEMGQTAPKGTYGSIKDYTEWWIQGMLSLQFNNPLSSFYIDTTGIVE
jgi:hypothetical protein